MYTFCQECETLIPPPPKKKTLYTNEDELLLTVKLKLSSL